MDSCLVFLDQLDMAASHRGIFHSPVNICRNEQVFNHAIGPQQIESIQKQLGIWRNALVNCVCQLQLLLSSVTSHLLLISLQEWREPLNKQGNVQSIGFAGIQNQVVLIQRNSV